MAQEPSDAQPHVHDEACALAHGADVPTGELPGKLMAVYASPVSRYLLHWGKDLGYETVLVEPDSERIEAVHRAHADAIVANARAAGADEDTDAVVTDHDAGDLTDQLAELLRTRARWIGLMGSRRHDPPHVVPLRERGFDDDTIARIHRPIGLDIGSKTPPEIALATLAGLVAVRRGREGGPHPG